MDNGPGLDADPSSVNHVNPVIKLNSVCTHDLYSVHASVLRIVLSLREPKRSERMSTFRYYGCRRDPVKKNRAPLFEVSTIDISKGSRCRGCDGQNWDMLQLDDHTLVQ